MAVNQERGPDGQAGRHGLDIAGVGVNQDETLPAGMVALGVGSELVEEGLLELEESLDVHAGDQGLGGGSGAIGYGNVFEVVVAGRQDGGTFVDFGWVEEVEDGEVLDMEDFVHTLEAESALSIEEVGDMGLFESGLLGETESGKFACFDSVQEDFSEVFLQDFELHGRSIAPVLGHGR